MTPTMIVDRGAYVQLYRSTNNTPKARSVGAMALLPSNDQGGYWFMYLKTGHKLHGYHWVELPISDEVIDRVEQLADEQGQLLMENGPIFEWTPGELIVDVDDNAEGMHEEMDQVVYPDEDDDDDDDFEEVAIRIGRPTVITDEEDSEDIDKDRSNGQEEYEGVWTNEANKEDEEDLSDGDEQEQRYELQDENELCSDHQGHNDCKTSSKGGSQSDEDKTQEHQTSNEGQRNTEPRRAKAGKGMTRLELSMKGKTHGDTKLQFMQKGKINNKDNCGWFVQLKNIAVNACFTQMSARKGIKRYGKLAIAAMLKEHK